jgi:GT2 family glycosyltransferase
MSTSTAIIILNWNSREMTANCIRSVRAMEAPSYDIIVVDNASTDGSAQYLAHEFPQIAVLPQSRNLGFAAGCNVGMRHALAKGAEYMLLLNNDTYVARDFLSELLAPMEADSKTAAVCSKIYFADRPDLLWYAGGDFNPWTGTSKHRGYKQIDRRQFDEQQDITAATGCAMLVRSKAVREVGLFDEQFWCYAEDLDWSLRFLKRGYRLGFAPKARVWHYDGATSVKSMGSGSHAIKQFYSTRNMVFVARKHVPWWQVPSYALGFAINHIGFYTMLRLWRGDLPALAAIYQGLSQGLRTTLRVSWQPEPSSAGEISGIGNANY